MTVQGTGDKLHFKMNFKICHRVFSLFACFSYFSAHDDILIRRPLRNLLHQVNFLHYDVMSWGNWHYSGPTILAPWWFWWLGMKMKLNIDERKKLNFDEKRYILTRSLYFDEHPYILTRKKTFWWSKLHFDVKNYILIRKTEFWWTNYILMRKPIFCQGNLHFEGENNQNCPSFRSLNKNDF